MIKEAISDKKVLTYNDLRKNLKRLAPSTEQYENIMELVDFVYYLGMDDGEYAGYNDALKDNGLSDEEREIAYDEGYDAGTESMRSEMESELDYNYDNGYDNGRESMRNEMDEIYEEGRSVGYEEGRSVGYEEGYNEGYEVGKVDGHAEGYDEGYDDGCDQIL